MSITLSPTHPDPDRYEGRGQTPRPDRYVVRERSRTTGQDITVHERFGDRGQAGAYAADRTDHEPHLYGDKAAHKLVVEDTGWGFTR